MKEFEETDDFSPKIRTEFGFSQDLTETLRKSFPALSESESNKQVEMLKNDLNQRYEIYLKKNKIMTNSPIKIPRSKAISQQSKSIDVEDKRKQAHEILLKVKLEKNEMIKREQERRRAFEEKLKKETELLTQHNIEMKEETLRKRKEEAFKSYELTKKKRDDEYRRLMEVKKRHNPISKNNYMYKKMEDKYEADILMPMLEEKKRKLAEMRNKYKPISKRELSEHGMNFDLLMAEREEKRQNNIREKQEKEINTVCELNQYKSSIMKRQREDDKQKKEERDNALINIKLRKEKMLSYANLVKETCTVRVSQHKIIELETAKAKLKHHVREPVDVRKSYDPILLKKERLNNPPKKLPKNSSVNNHPKLPPKSDKRKQPKVTILHSDRGGNEERKYPSNQLDYLKELRLKRENNYELSKPSNLNWKNDLNNNSMKPTERYNRVLDKANHIEKNAKMKEQLLKVKGGAEENPTMGKEISDMYLDAIKAKLAVLENL